MSKINLLKKIKQSVEIFIGEEELFNKLKLNKTLRVKLGIDPTKPDLTFGHLVVFNKLRQLQDLGHQGILIIGDYTATIGDPSGRSETRPDLSREVVLNNSKTYIDQAFKILDQNKTEIYFNSKWFDKMSLLDVVNLAGKMTVAQMLERNDFYNRYQNKTAISIKEFLYPLLQGYDSLVVDSDIELGGTDQLFNLHVGRILQKEAKKNSQSIICMPLLIGLDGSKKMSKSYNNYIALNDSPDNIFGKIMSINDNLMYSYYDLLLEKDIKNYQESNPMIIKENLATSLISKIYSKEEAKNALKEFKSVFCQGNLPNFIPEFMFSILSSGQFSLKLIDLIYFTKLFSSKKEIKRLIDQNAVKMNNKKINNSFLLIQKPKEFYIFQVGKRNYFKILP